MRPPHGCNQEHPCWRNTRWWTSQIRSTQPHSCALDPYLRNTDQRKGCLRVFIFTSLRDLSLLCLHFNSPLSVESKTLVWNLKLWKNSSTFWVKTWVNCSTSLSISIRNASIHNDIRCLLSLSDSFYYLHEALQRDTDDKSWWKIDCGKGTFHLYQHFPCLMLLECAARPCLWKSKRLLFRSSMLYRNLWASYWYTLREKCSFFSIVYPGNRWARALKNLFNTGELSAEYVI